MSNGITDLIKALHVNVAYTQLYKSLCRLVHPFVGLSVAPGILFPKERWSYFRYCLCPTYATDAVVYTALFLKFAYFLNSNRNLTCLYLCTSDWAEHHGESNGIVLHVISLINFMQIGFKNNNPKSFLLHLILGTHELFPRVCRGRGVMEDVCGCHLSYICKEIRRGIV